MNNYVYFHLFTRGTRVVEKYVFDLFNYLWLYLCCSCLPKDDPQNQKEKKKKKIAPIPS